MRDEFDEVETIDRNPKSWVAWKREAERLQGIIDGMALAAMDREPVCFVSERNLATLTKYRAAVKVKAEPVMVRPVALYRHAQSAPDRDQVRSEHAEWSQATFGNVGPIGPLKHLSKEALEAAAEPDDLSEWADMQFLLWDAQRRAGITDEQITKAMIEKLAVNKLRDWPEPKDGEPRLHIKEQPAPVVPDERDKTVDADDHPLLWSFNEGWSACRAAMLQAGTLTNEGETILHNYRTAMEGIGHIRRTLEETFGGLHGTHVEPDVLMDCKTICDAIYAAYSGNSPVIPDGWVACSERLPDETQPVITVSDGGVVQRTVYQFCEGVWSDWYEQYDDVTADAFTHWMPLPAAPQEVR